MKQWRLEPTAMGGRDSGVALGVGDVEWGEEVRWDRQMCTDWCTTGLSDDLGFGLQILLS